MTVEWRSPNAGNSPRRSAKFARSHPDFIVIYGWFDPMWDVGSDAVAGDSRAGGKESMHLFWEAPQQSREDHLTYCPAALQTDSNVRRA